MKLDRSKYLESRSLKPVTILLSVLIINVLLAAIVWAFPKDGIAVGEWNLKFASFDDFKEGADTLTEVVVMEKVLQGINPIESLSEKDRRNLEFSKRVSDEIKTSSFYDTTLNTVVQMQSRSIQVPPNNPDCLNTILEALYKEADEDIVRILHYGDSQLEGDRITDYFRNRMQALFGGQGPGMVLPKEPAAGARRSVYVSQSKNFSKKAVYVKGAYAEKGRYGLGCASFQINAPYSRFKGFSKVIDSTGIIDSSAVFNGNNAPAFISIKNGKSAFKYAKEYNQIGLLYRNSEHCKVRLTSDNFVEEYVLPPSNGASLHQWQLKTEKAAKIEFIAGKFPEIYGVSLDGENGVAVDNFAMRGSAAIGFSAIDSNLYKQQCELMGVKCILLQYGINVVPNVRSDYSYYKKMLAKQLIAIRRASPEASIIVIGPSDMSRNRRGVRESYSNIPLIRDAMRDAAFETGCAFWDLYEAMGGKNSMVSWVNQGLGQKDYTHFSFEGAKYVGELLYEAFLEQIHIKYPIRIQ